MLRILVINFVMALAFSTVLVAADFYQLGPNGDPTSFLLINEHGICDAVGNNGTNVYFIPTRTATEWQAFINNHPADTQFTGCCAKFC